MGALSCNWIIALLIIFTFFLVRAWMQDREREEKREQERDNCSTCAAIEQQNRGTKEGFHAAVVTAMKDEHAHGSLAPSKVERMLNVTRDQIIRGAIMGAIGGSAIDALNSAVTWSLVGGVVSGFSDVITWAR
jgi:hypothetical protein